MCKSTAFMQHNFYLNIHLFLLALITFLVLSHDSLELAQPSHLF